MIVVSDTSPLNYLVLIECDHVLPTLFERVYVPGEVVRELRHPKTPALVREWIESPASWVIVKSPARALPSTAGLGAGEAHALALARELGISDVLIDEYEGRMVHRRKG